MRAGNITNGLFALAGTGPALSGSYLLFTEDDIEVCCQPGTAESVIPDTCAAWIKTGAATQAGGLLSLSLFARPPCRSSLRNGPRENFVESSLWPHAFLCSRW